METTAGSLNYSSDIPAEEGNDYRSPQGRRNVLSAGGSFAGCGGEQEKGEGLSKILSR